VRVGFIGCGRHATTALYPSLRPAGLELVATCARRFDRAEQIAKAFGAARAYDNVTALIAGGDLDAVLVALPPEAYLEVILPLLDAGLPVFCEKPGAGSLEQLERIDAESNAAGVPVMVGYMKRFARAYRVASDFSRRDDFGRVTSIHCKFLMGPGFGSLRNYVIDNPVHALDLMRFLGGEVAEVQARYLRLDDTKHALSLLLAFESGAVGTAQLGTTGSFFQENELLEVVGEEHSVTVTNVDTVVCRRPRGPVEVDRPSYTVPLTPNLTGTVMGFVPELAHFKAVVLDGVPCKSDIASARKTLALAEQVLSALG